MDIVMYIVDWLRRLLPDTIFGWTIGFVLSVFLLTLINKNVRESFKAMIFAITTLARKGKNRIDWFRLSLFLKEDYLIEKVNDIELQDEDRSYLFKTILNTKIRISVKLVKEYVQSIYKKRIHRMTKEQLIAELMLLVQKIINSYEADIQLEFVKKYGSSLGKKLYQCVYEGKCENITKTGFKEFHKKNVELITNSLKDDLESSIKDVSFVLYRFIGNIHVALNLAITDLEKTFYHFNGNLNEILNKQR